MKLISATVVVIKLCSLRVIVCVEVLRPSQSNVVMSKPRSVYQTTRLLGRLSPLSG